MAKTAAERQRERRARIKSDKQLYEQMKQKERERWRERVAQHKVKTVADMSAREVRYRRKHWRDKWKERQANIIVNESNVTDSSLIVTPNSVSRQKERGREVVRRDRAAAYRRIVVLEHKLHTAERTVAKLRKRELRLRNKNKNKDIDSKPESRLTPRKLTTRIMSSPRKTRKTLLLHYSMMTDVRASLSNVSRQHRKIALSVLCATKLVRKHRLQAFMRKSIGISRSAVMTRNAVSKRSSLSELKSETVRNFFEQDTASRMTGGKKDTITRKKQKRQKRFLLEPVSKLHKVFQKEYQHMKISRAAFARFKPFWVQRPSIRDRDTCLCTPHENLRLMYEKLKVLKLIIDKTLSETIAKTVCDVSNKSCMYSECSDCCKNQPTFETSEYSDDHITSWWNWQQVTHIVANGKRVRRTVKKRVSGSIAELKNKFLEQMHSLKPHVFRVTHQTSAARSKRAELAANEVLLHIDFSENWTTKNLSEVQSAHFGSSLRQITLHTGVIYSQCKPVSFCTVSDNYDHGPISVWSHLLPVLRFVKDINSHATVLHIVSDGPTTQYRNRTNFYLCTVIPHLLGFSIWWNFSEAGHGKSAADGVGGTVKRLADARILAGQEIQNAAQLYNCLQDITSVKLFLVDKFIVLSEKVKIPPVPGTMKIHQFTAKCDGTLIYRDLTCYCSNSEDMCDCYPKKVINVCPEDPCTLNVPAESLADPVATSTFNEVELLNIEFHTTDTLNVEDFVMAEVLEADGSTLIDPQLVTETEPSEQSVAEPCDNPPDVDDQAVAAEVLEADGSTLTDPQLVTETDQPEQSVTEQMNTALSTKSFYG